jgi:hypothetical protein
LPASCEVAAGSRVALAVTASRRVAGLSTVGASRVFLPCSLGNSLRPGHGLTCASVGFAYWTRRPALEFELRRAFSIEVSPDRKAGAVARRGHREHPLASLAKPAVIEMTPSEIQNIAVPAVRACAAAANHPRKKTCAKACTTRCGRSPVWGRWTTQRTPLISSTCFGRRRCGQTSCDAE